MKFLVFLLTFCISSSWASTTMVNTEDSKLQAKGIMDNVYQSFIEIIPYVYSDENMVEKLKKDPVAKAKLLKDLNEISSFFKSAKHAEYFQRPGLKPTLDTMNSHLEDTINSITNNNFAFTQKRLNVLTSLCISCHGQLSAKGAANAFGDSLSKAERNKFESDFAYGNYLYLIRRFDDSEKYFLMAIDHALIESRTNELYSSMRRIMSIHTKISFDYKRASAFTEKYISNPALPQLAKNTFKSWNTSLKEWKDYKSEAEPNIEVFIKKYLSPLEDIKEQTGDGKNDITLLVAAGVFSKYLNDHPKSELTPQILYWLSIAEKRLSNTYFFTLSELYLKDCIKRFSKSPYAKKCYGLYEENITLGFTGSSGVDIPADEKKELIRLREYLKP